MQENNNTNQINNSLSINLSNNKDDQINKSNDFRKIIDTSVDGIQNVNTNQDARYKYLKIGLVSAAALFVIIISIYFLLSNKTVNVPNVNNVNFPNLTIGKDIGQNTYGDKSTSTEDSDAFHADYVELLHVWPKAITGYYFIKSLSSSTPSYILFTDKETGNIYQANSPSYEKKKLTDTTFLNTQKAAFTPDGEYVAMSYINSNDKKINPSQSLIISEIPRIENGPLNTDNIIDENIVDFTTFSGEKTQKQSDFVIYLKKTKDNFSELYIYNIKTEEKNKLLEIPLTDIFLEWKTFEKIQIKTKPTSFNTQQLIIVNPLTKKISSLDTKENNSFENPLNKNVLGIKDRVLTLYDKLYSSSKKEFNFSTNPDKCDFVETLNVVCAVSSEDEFAFDLDVLDDWYKGRVQWNDKFRIYNITQDTLSEYNLSDISGESIDVYNIKNYNYKEEEFSGSSLLFQNKRDLSLWILDLGYLLN